MPAERFWTAPLVMLVAIGALARLQYLRQPMRYDESVTFVNFAAGPWRDVVSSYTYPNNHVFHTLLVKACVAVFGDNPWAIRLPAFVAGVAMVPMAYSVGRRLFGSLAAYIAAALIAASGALALYSTNARGYTIVCLATLVLIDVFLRLRDDPSTTLWIVAALVAAFGMWTIPVMLFPAGGLALWFTLSALSGDTHNGRADLNALGLCVLLAAVASAALYAPILAHAGRAALDANAFVRPTPLPTFLGEFSASLKPTVSAWVLGWPIAISALLGACTLTGLLYERKPSGMRVSMIGSMYVWCAITLLLTRHAPFPRVWLFWTAPIALLAAYGTVVLLADVGWARTWIAPRPGYASVAVALLLALAVRLSHAVERSNDTGTLRDAAGITNVLASMLRPGDRVIAPIPSNAPLAYYFIRGGLDTSYLSPGGIASGSTYLIVNTDEGYTLQSPLRDARMGKFSRAESVVRFPSAEVYRLY